MSIKQINVTFEYDTETDLVSKVCAFVDGIEKKKVTTRKAPKTKDIVLESEAILVREDNKLIFNNKAATDMGIKAEDRIVIKYEKMGKSKVPVIGTDLAWKEEGAGNKVTKTNTVTYRGKANTVLSDFGTTFKLESYKEDLWKLISTDPLTQVPKTLDEAITQAEDVNLDIFTTDDNNIDIDELTFVIQ